MYLKALEIQGFKSFPDKTRLNFDQEITAIVGPNGSGKSNISDAILWVMGEQRTKTLRGGKMEDVIFGGTEKRSPMGFAQVSLILDNSTGIFDTENTEVMITRRYYRSGESEYYINREACRLRDINELLMDTGLGRDGYSIIGQGRIAEIVSGKSNERREIFEEAAGISRYRYRKEESERKLARTEENLLRINDKVDELELQVEPLRKQAETAKKYLRLRDELKSAEVSVWMETLDRLHAQAETVNHDYQTAKENLAGAQRELEQLYAASENIAQKMREKDLESERTREQISEAESAAAECESAAAVVRTNLQNSADSIARLRVEVSEQTDRADALQAQIDAQQRRLQEIEAEKAQHAQEIQSVLAEIDRNAASSGEAERAYTELLAKESAQSSALAECRTRITLLADKSQELLDQENAVATAAAEAAEHLAALETQQQEKQTAQQQARTACDALRAEQREKAQRLSACEQALTRQQERLSGLTVDLRSTESRIRMLTEMEKDFEGYNRAVKAVMHAAEKGTLRGVRGPVANLIKTGDRYALAIETALGAAAQNIVVDTQSCGAQAIELLRRRETGRATFLPLDTIRPMHLNSVPDQEPGYVGVADTLVTCAAAYRNIVSNLLGRTVVAETMKDAIAISRRYDHRYRIVTLDGQLVNAGGSLTGGSAAKGSGILSRANELKRLRAALDTLTLEKKQCEAELEDAQTALDAAHAQLDTVQAQLEQAVETLHKAESEAAQVALLKNAAQETIAGQNASIDACRAQQKANQDRIAAARADALSAEQALAALRAERDRSELGRGAFDRRRQELADQLAGLRAESASLDAERETITRTTQQIHDLFEEMTGDRTARLAQIEQAEAGTQQLQQTLQMHERRLAELLRRLCRIDGIGWIRLHYAYPAGFPDEVIEAMASEPKICKYLDIPFQHISDAQLASMHRRHTKAEAMELIGRLRGAIPDLALRTTLLVGYPGETEADFAELEQFVRDVRFERLGVFAYSEEEGTYSAQELKDDVPEEVKQQRVERIMTLQNDIARENNLRRVGRTERVLIDSRQGDYYVGRTQYDSPEVDQEILIPAAERRLLRGHFYEIRIDGAADYDLYGKAVRK